MLYYLDEVGFSLALPVTYTWSKRGSKNRLKAPSRWGSHGRLNLIGALSWSDQRLHFNVVEGSVTSERVIAFIEVLTQNASAERVTVVVLGPSEARTPRNNAAFHTSGKLNKQRVVWEQQNIFLRHLPPYCPHLNPIEALWKRLKAFLLPRRCYDSTAQLKQAVHEVLALLGAIRVDSSLGGA